MVVSVVMGISSDLLSLAGNTTVLITKGITVWVAVEVNLGLLMTDSNAIIIIDWDRLESHDIVAQSLLKLRGHKIIARSGPVENGEMNLEPEEVEEERHDDESDRTSGEVLSEFNEGQRALAAIDVH